MAEGGTEGRKRVGVEAMVEGGVAAGERGAMGAAAGDWRGGLAWARVVRGSGRTSTAAGVASGSAAGRYEQRIFCSWIERSALVEALSSFSTAVHCEGEEWVSKGSQSGRRDAARLGPAGYAGAPRIDSAQS